MGGPATCGNGDANHNVDEHCNDKPVEKKVSPSNLQKIDEDKAVAVPIGDGPGGAFGFDAAAAGLHCLNADIMNQELHRRHARYEFNIQSREHSRAGSSSAAVGKVTGAAGAGAGGAGPGAGQQG